MRRLRDHPAPTAMSTPCRLWQGGCTRDGYGQTKKDGKRYYIHRWAWERVNGPIAPGLVLMHLCDNRLCYRLDHLRPGTPAENQADKAAKRRARSNFRPDAGGRVPLSDVLVRMIHAGLDAGLSITEVAESVHVSRATVYKYKRDRT